MPDLGHEVRLGIFLTPAAAQPHRAVELGVLADAVGIDLVTVQDHPYQAAHLDSWTLLSWIAARTTRVRLALNVANLPLRTPVLLARSVATLDLLSGGRADLGLGAGAFWDGIAAAGGPRRSPGEAVDALVEAVDVVRQVWSGQGPVRVEGQHYRVRGLHAGPAPGGDPSVWIGAYGPRMLRVTGRFADGWVPSMGYLPPEKLAWATARVDRAAVDAGRAPQDVVRLYNVHGRFGRGTGLLQGAPADWAEQLAGLLLEHGTSIFVLATDDPQTVRTFAQEVGPLLRELVGAERSRPSVGQDANRVAVPAAVPATTVPEGITPTPDDGVRLTDDVAWDEGSRPSAPAPEGAPTAYPSERLALPQHLLDVHDHLRAELASVRDVVEQVRGGHLQVGQARSVLNTMAMRQNNWTLGAFCESYCRILTGHHTLEDRSMFPHLRDREPALGPVLDRLEEEHEVIADVLDRLDRALVALVGEDGYGQAGRSALDELDRSVDVLTDALLSHLSYEERELVGPLARHGFG